MSITATNPANVDRVPTRHPRAPAAVVWTWVHDSGDSRRGVGTTLRRRPTPAPSEG